MKFSKHLRVFILPTLLFLFMSLASPLGVSAKPGGGGSTPNLPPVITNANESVITDVNVTADGVVTATDAVGQILKFSISVRAANGTAYINPSTGSWTYTPKTDYVGSDSFTVKVSDPLKKYALSKISVTIKAATPPPPLEAIHYVALGDSIATGTIHPFKSEESYVYKFYTGLKTQFSGRDVILHDLPVDGYQSKDIYNNLGLNGTAGDTTTIEAIKIADIITISIGGNNLMQAAYHESDGSYDFFSNLQFNKADQGLKDFNDQWAAIIQRINELNPDPNLQIIVNTQYNPYDSLRDSALHTTVDLYLTGIKTVVIDNVTHEIPGINDVIRNNQTSLGYKIADVYTGFDAYSTHMVDIVYLYAASLFELPFLNPHPRQSGQDIITNLNKAQFNPLLIR